MRSFLQSLYQILNSHLILYWAQTFYLLHENYIAVYTIKYQGILYKETVLRILVVEDNLQTLAMIEQGLQNHGIIVDAVNLVDDALEQIKLYKYELIVLDLLLPDKSGYELLESLRNNQTKTPVLILSGLNSSADKIKGLGFGADDFLTKPFDIGELIARIKAIVRRVHGHGAQLVQVGEILIDLEKHTTTVNMHPVHFTAKEQAVMEILAMKIGKPISKENFLSLLYSGYDDPEIKVVDVFICKIRRKLEKFTERNYIKTVWGRGYILDNIAEHS